MARAVSVVGYKASITFSVRVGSGVTQHTVHMDSPAEVPYDEFPAKIATILGGHLGHLSAAADEKTTALLKANAELERERAQLASALTEAGNQLDAMREVPSSDKPPPPPKRGRSKAL